MKVPTSTTCSEGMQKKLDAVVAFLVRKMKMRSRQDVISGRVEGTGIARPTK
jgi:hypothetical protein